MDETKNWITIVEDEEGNAIIKYDPVREEIIDLRTGEVLNY